MLRLLQARSGPIKASGSCTVIIVSQRNAKSYSSSATDSSNQSSGETGDSSNAISQRQLREKAVAEAVAREEQAQAKAKMLAEFKFKSQESISRLNQTPNTLIKTRLQQLQQSLDSLEDQLKVQKLDKQLEKFMIEQMRLPSEELSNRPWASIESTKKTLDPTANGSDANGNGDIKSDGAANEIKSTASNSLLNTFPYLKPTPEHHEYSTQELYLRHLNHSRHSGNLGSKLSNVYIPKHEISKPRSIKDITISTLLAAGCHLGHAKAMWRPSTQPFIYGEYDGIHLIDLNETLVALKRAIKVIKGVANKGGLILYVGTSQIWEQERALEQAANRSNSYYISRKWIPGTITNFTQVTQQPNEKRMEITMLDQPTNRNLDPNSKSGLIKPDLVVIMNPVDNRNCINECIKLRIPTIGLCDTDMEPSLLTYPIPSNDDSMRVSSMMLGVLSRAAQEGTEERIQKIKAFSKQQRN